MPVTIDGTGAGEPIAGLDGASLEVMETYRSATAPDPGALDTLWTQLEADIAGGMTPQVGDGGAGAAAASEAVTAANATATGGVSWGVVAGAVGVLAAGGVAIALLFGGTNELPQPEPVEPSPVAVPEQEVPAPEPLDSTVEPSALEPTTGETPELETTSPVAKSSSKHGAKPRSVRAEAGADAPEPKASLADERALLQKARSALAAGKPTRARSILRDYDQRFESRMLGEERDVLEIRAMCQLGDREAAERRAERFRKDHPLSPHRQTLLRACE